MKNTESERLKALVKKKQEEIKSLKEEIEGCRELVKLASAFVLEAAGRCGEVRISRKSVSGVISGGVSFARTEEEYIIKAEGGKTDDTDKNAAGDN